MLIDMKRRGSCFLQTFPTTKGASMNAQRASFLVGILTGISMNASAADMLTTKDGITVYTFDKDTPGKSVCKDTCAATWQPVTPDMMSMRVTSITRDDGGKQAAVNGKPLYLFAGDHKPGDKTGNGVLGVWHIVTISEQNPKGSSSSSGSSSGSPSGSTGY
jgi:predicted lipoprotein with Yx(FWY)xxD motif